MWNSIVDGVTGAIDAGLSLDPQYARMKAHNKRLGENYKGLGLVVCVAAVAMSIIGLGVLAAGSSACVLPLGIAVVFWWAGGNCVKMGTNLVEASDNPVKYADKSTLMKKLAEGTYYWDWAVQSLVYNMK